MSYCPNKNTKEYQEMKQALGDNLTHYIWNENNGNPIHLASNGKESKLFNDLLELTGDKTKAIQAKAQVYSKEFRGWFGDWLNPTIFTAWNVDNIDKLKEKYPSDLLNKYYHHSTNNFGLQKFNDKENSKSKLKIVGRLTTNKIDALIVDNKDSNNKYSHITLATAEGIKPFESNKEIENNLDKIQPLNDTIDVTFKNNLNDQVSKIIDENGEPLIVYHGSDKNFDRFIKELNGSNTNTKDSRLGIFFSDNKLIAKTYSNKNLYSSYLNGRNLKIVNDLNEYNGNKFASNISKAKSSNYDSILFKNVNDNNISINNIKSDIYSVFNSNQIKSAIPPSLQQEQKFNLDKNKIGKFDENSDNIYYSPRENKKLLQDALKEYYEDIDNELDNNYSSSYPNNIDDRLENEFVTNSLLNQEKELNKNLQKGRINNLFYHLEYSKLTYSDEVYSNYLENIYNNYDRAIGKHSSYRGNLKYHIASGYGILYSPFENDDSVLVGQNIDDIFIVSHFAPTSMLAGYDLIKEASNSKMPIIMAVPEFLSKQLKKAGFRFIIEIPQTFAGETIMKNVMVNKATTEEDLQKLFRYYVDNYQNNTSNTSLEPKTESEIKPESNKNERINLATEIKNKFLDKKYLQNYDQNSFKISNSISNNELKETINKINYNYKSKIAFLYEDENNRNLEIIPTDNFLQRYYKKELNSIDLTDYLTIDDNNVSYLNSNHFDPKDPLDLNNIDNENNNIEYEEIISEGLNNMKKYTHAINSDIEKQIKNLEIKRKKTINKEEINKYNKNIAILRDLNSQYSQLDKNIKIKAGSIGLANVFSVFETDAKYIKSLLDDPITNREQITAIVDFYKKLGTFDTSVTHPLFNNIEKILTYAKLDSNVNNFLEGLKLVKEQFILYGNEVNKAFEEKTNEIINNNKKIQKSYGEGISIKELITPMKDISLYDYLLNNASTNTFSNDNLIPAIARDELQKKFDETRSEILPIKEGLSSLHDKVIKKLKTIKKSSIISTSFDIFYQRNEYGHRTNRVIHRFSAKWFNSFYTQLKLAKQYDISSWLKDNSKVVDYTKLPEIHDIFSNDEKISIFIKGRKDAQYSNELKNRLGNKLYNEIVQNAIKNINDFFIYEETALTNYGKNLKGLNKDNAMELLRDKQNHIHKNNPFLIIDNFSNNSGNLYSRYNIYIPRENIDIVDENNQISSIKSDYYDNDFDKIMNDEDLYNYWGYLIQAVKYINNSFSDSTSYLATNSIPLLEKTFSEVLVDSEIKGGFIKRFKQFFLSIIDSIKNKVRSSINEEILATDAKGINKNVNDKRNTTFSSIYNAKLAEWISIGGNSKESILVSDLNDKQTKFLTNLFGLNNSKLDLQRFVQSDLIDPNRIIREYTNEVLIQDSSKDIPRIIESSLIAASEYTARKEILPLMNYFKEVYENTPRERISKGSNSSLSNLKDNLVNESANREKANKRFEFFYNKAVRGQFDKTVSAKLELDNKENPTNGESLKTEKSKFKRILNSILTGKLYTKSEKEVLSELNKGLKAINSIFNNKNSEIKNNFIDYKNGKIDKTTFISNLKDNLTDKESDILDENQFSEYKSLINKYDNLSYSKDNLGGYVTINSLIDSILSMLIFKGLAFNISSGLTNRIEGKFASMLIDSTGTYWTPGNIYDAEKFISQAFKKRLNKNSNYAKQWNIFESIMGSYQILQEASNELQKNSIKTSIAHAEKFSPYYIPITVIEKRNQGTNVIAILMDTKIEDKNKNSYFMFENGEFTAFDTKNGKLILKDKFRTPKNIENWEKLKGPDYIEFKTKVVQAISTIHGDYEELGGFLLKTFSAGKVLGLFKTWLPAQIWNRFAVQQQNLNTVSGEFKGRWRSLTGVSGAILGGTVGLIGGPVTTLLGGTAGLFWGLHNNIDTEISGIKELTMVTKSILLKTIMTPLNLFGIGKNINYGDFSKMKLSKIDELNLKSNIAEISLLLSMLLFKLFLSNLRGWDTPDDKDDANKFRYKMYLLFENKIMGLLGNASMYANPKVIYDQYTQNGLYMWISNIDKAINDLDKTVLGQVKDPTHTLYKDVNKLVIPAFAHGFGVSNYMKKDWSNDILDKEIKMKNRKKQKDKKAEEKKKKLLEKEKEKRYHAPKKRKKKKINNG